MSFLAKLIIDENTMNVLDCSFNFEQGADHTGKPSQRPKGGQINLLIETSKKIDFSEWIISQDSIKNGEIVFYRRDNLSSLKKITFKDAHCISYHESFNADDNDPFKTRLVVSAENISINSDEFKNLWPRKE